MDLKKTTDGEANAPCKWQGIFERLQANIRKGVYSSKLPLPSEEAICRQYKVSRITVKKAMDELRARGLVYRKQGSGTFITKSAFYEAGRLGLIFPSLSFGEIFPVMCQALTRIAQADGFSFIFGDISSPMPNIRAHEACQVARQFVNQRVAGVIMQPLAFLKSSYKVTREITNLFASAEIPVVLMDRDVDNLPIKYDFIGIDNLGAGRALGAYLTSCGAKNIHFLMRPNCASVIRDRLDGVRSSGCLKSEKNVITSEPSDVAILKKYFMRKHGRPDAVICESDFIAAQLRNTLLSKFKLRTPEDVMLAGFDDVRCASLMTPPLTTIHQPCNDLALLAYKSLRERIKNPDLPSRKILLPAPLVVRESTINPDGSNKEIRQS